MVENLIVKQIKKTQLSVLVDTIINVIFKYFLDYPVQLDGLTYLNGEAAFQAGKVTTHNERLTFVGIPPNIAKSKGRKVKLRSDWETIK